MYLFSIIKDNDNVITVNINIMFGSPIKFRSRCIFTQVALSSLYQLEMKCMAQFMKRLLCYWLVATSFVVDVDAQTVTCGTAFECANSTVNGVNVIYANGYKSIAGPDASVSTPSNDLRIRGAYGAYRIGGVIADDIFIYSDSGLSHSSGSVAIITAAVCFGANSCSYATISADASTGDSVYRCWAQQSCAHSSLSEVNTIDAYGAYSWQW